MQENYHRGESQNILGIFPTTKILSGEETQNIYKTKLSKYDRLVSF